MTVTDETHVEAARQLREEFARPPAREDDNSLARDLADYDRAFGLEVA